MRSETGMDCGSHPQNPQRPPAWRWHLSGQLLADPARSPVLSDERLGILADLADEPAEESVPLPCATDGLTAAYRIWSEPDHLWDRTLLEARILTGEDTIQIAKRLEIPSSLVDVYEQVFFDVRSRLACTTFIRHRAIGWLDSAPPGLERLPAALKLYAYFGGEHVLDALLSVFWHSIQPIEVRDAALSRDVERVTQFLALVAVGGHLGLLSSHELDLVCQRLAEFDILERSTGTVIWPVIDVRKIGFGDPSENRLAASAPDVQVGAMGTEKGALEAQLSSVAAQIVLGDGTCQSAKSTPAA